MIARVVLWSLLAGCAQAGSGDSAARDASTADAATGGVDDVDRLAMVLVIGDSVAAGFNAHGQNAPGGHGYARLLFAENLEPVHPSLMFFEVTHSGADSSEVLADLRVALGGSLPKAVPGDVLILINVGGNDFNDHLATILDTSHTTAAASTLRSNLAEMIGLLRERYAAGGNHVELMVDNLYDPTDGMGTVPAQFTQGFCETIQNPLLNASLRMTALHNLDLMNQAIADETAAQGGHLIDLHAAFLGHGMNAGADRWIDADCAHPLDQGHDLIRRLIALRLKTRRSR